MTFEEAIKKLNEVHPNFDVEPNFLQFVETSEVKDGKDFKVIKHFHMHVKITVLGINPDEPQKTHLTKKVGALGIGEDRVEAFNNAFINAVQLLGL